MSTGLSLLKKLCVQQSRNAFRRINPSHFIAEEQPLFEYVNHHYRTYGALPTLEALNDNGFSMMAVRDNETADYYLQRVADRFIVLQSRDVLQPLQTAIVNGNAEQIVTLAAQLHGTVRSTQTNSSVIQLAELVDQVVEQFQHARTSPGIQGATLGYPWLDEITGGVQAGDMVSMAARTGMGKSYFLNHMAMHAWLAGSSCLYVSMEMTAIHMMTRFIAQFTGINPDNIRRGMLSQWTMERLYAQCEALKQGPPFTIVDGSFRLTVDDVDDLVQEFNPDLVYIDAAYLMIPKEQRFTEKGWERQREMSKDVKRLALSRGKGVVQTLQLNSDARGKKRDGLDSGMIGGSIGISQDSTTVILLTEGESPNEYTTRDLVIDKNRDGRKGWMRTNFLFDPMDFDLVTTSDDQDEDGEVQQTPGWTAG